MAPPARVLPEVSGLPGRWVQTSLGLCDPVGGTYHHPHSTEENLRHGLLGFVVVSLMSVVDASSV